MKHQRYLSLGCCSKETKSIGEGLGGDNFKQEAIKNAGRSMSSPLRKGSAVHGRGYGRSE